MNVATSMQLTTDLVKKRAENQKTPGFSKPWNGKGIIHFLKGIHRLIMLFSLPSRL